jgi:hypothetical protein
MQTAIVALILPHLQVVIAGMLWYFLAGIIGSILAHRTQAVEWCNAHPWAALAIGLVRKSGLDVYGSLVLLRDFARRRSGADSPEN